MSNVPSSTQQVPTAAAETRRERRFSYLLTFSVDGLEIPSANISLHGAQLCCPYMRYTAFKAASRNQKTRLNWNIPDDPVAISSKAALRYANLCDDEYLIGLEFTEFEGDSEQKWCDFIDTLGDTHRNTHVATPTKD
jgi:hypothetical protein